MKLRKLIGTLFVAIISIFAVCVTKTYAANSSYILGLTNIREDKGAYQIAPHGQVKKIWKIVSYPNTGSTVPNYNNAFYCIKAEHGFVVNNGSSVTDIRKIYDTSFNMKTQKDEVMSRLNSIDVFTTDKTSYNKILWIVDHMYLPKAEDAKNTKQELLTAAGITEYEDGILLTDSDIEVVQQLALWYFTNPKDSNYNNSELPILLFNDNSGSDSGYKSFEDLYNNNLENTKLGLKRQYQAEDLYKYFITNADGKYNPKDATSPIKLETGNFKAVKQNNSYIVGPLKISADTTRQYNISELKFTDQDGKEIKLTGENKLLNANKQVVASGNIKDVINQEFYISLPISTNITNVNFNIKGSFNKTDATYYTTSAATYLQEQPVVLVEKVKQAFSGKAQVELPKTYFDLALRKFITKVDNQNITNRIPKLSIGQDGNIKYTHTKEPVEVQTNNIVTYTLRIYNEGTISGYAKEITDNLPEGLEFLPQNETNKQYRWKMIDKNGNQTTDVKKAVKITTDYLSKEQEKTNGANLIKEFDKSAGITNKNPDYRDVQVAFKVIEPNKSDRILTNIAEISEDADMNNDPIDDIDSIPGNNKQGEDDIDVEHVKLVYFDLALRKFITKVDNLDINNRIPKLSMGKDGNITYTHTKEPVEVEQNNIVTYTLRIYNEGKMAGYASQITDNLPEGLEFLPQNDTNKQYRWKMIDKDGNETSDVKKAVKITTDYLSKEQEKTNGANLIKAFDKTAGLTDKNPDYKDVKIAFKVTEPNTSDRIIINTAEISEDADKNNKPVDDIDSIPGNNKPGEDDIDIEKIKVRYFDLALKKWVSTVVIIEDGKETITNTGHTGYENPEPVVKVDLKAKDLKKVTVKFGYKIKVINEGQIEGYAKEVKDYIPDGLKFVAADNPKWKALSEKVVVTNQLENTLLKPGESATVDILLTWENSENNLGKKVNVAEISKDYNESHTPDIDSTPDNKKPGEDDIDDAPVLLSVKTGEIRLYIGFTIIMLVTFAGGVILIKKYVM